MELRYVQTPTVSSIPRNGLTENSFLQVISLPTYSDYKKKCTSFRRISPLDFKPRTSGTTKIKSQAVDAAPSDVPSKDSNLVFVAGATGKVGSRTVRELLKLGFNVRAGVRSVKRAESLVQSVQNMKLEDGTLPIDKLELVECDLEKPGIKRALGNSSVIICCIGASEKEIFDVTGPYRIDYQATKNLIDAATSAKVDHFVLLTSLGTNKFGFPAAVLNLFWGVLCWKRKAEEALLTSGLPYTIVRAGGMERPTDSYKETHNITLSEEDTWFGGQVSNLQVAELLAFMAKNRSLSYCKVVEVIAETSAPLTPMAELLKKIPSKREEVYLPKKPEDKSTLQPVPDSTYTEKEPEPEPEPEPEQAKPTIATPLSPYIAYEDLKPPTSPIPTPSTSSSTTKAITPVATSPVASSTVENSSETSNIIVDDIIPQNEMKKPYSLSPYSNYEDLKPPSSPTPTPSSGSGSLKASNPEIVPNAASSTSSPIEVVNSIETLSISVDNGIPEISVEKPYSLSPYASYEDLKPPTSPTPTPSSSKKEEPSIIETSVEVPLQVVGGNGDAKSGTVSDIEKAPAEPLAPELSPYLAYDDLKPPSSPSPSVPTISPENSKVEEKAGNVDNSSESKAQPLSPYTMYEDLKPPSSPVPSPRKL